MRRARPADIDALVQLEADSFATDQLSRRSFLSLAKSPSASLLVACHGGQVVGYVVLLFRRGGLTARLYSIAVDASRSGRGVGSRLLAASEETARKKRAERLRLEVRADNAPAIRFYERRGYREIGRRADYYADGMTALLLACDLRRATRHAALPHRLSRAA